MNFGLGLNNSPQLLFRRVNSVTQRRTQQCNHTQKEDNPFLSSTMLSFQVLEVPISSFGQIQWLQNANSSDQ